jgi:hypothetical protein
MGHVLIARSCIRQIQTFVPGWAGLKHRRAHGLLAVSRGATLAHTAGEVGDASPTRLASIAAYRQVFDERRNSTRADTAAGRNGPRRPSRNWHWPLGAGRGCRA